MTGDYFNIFYNNIQKQIDKNVAKILNDIDITCENYESYLNDYYKSKYSVFDDMITMGNFDFSQKIKTIEEIDKLKQQSNNSNKPKCWD